MKWELIFGASGAIAAIVVPLTLAVLSHVRGAREDRQQANTEERRLAAEEREAAARRLQGEWTMVKEAAELTHAQNVFLIGRINDLERQLQAERDRSEELRRELAVLRRTSENQEELIASLEQELAERSRRIQGLVTEIARLREGTHDS